MPSTWTDKQERKYEHIRDSEHERGASLGRAKEIAARTVNKERARKGRTKEQLYNEAKRRGVKGRSSMTKAQLQRAVDAKSS
jgi:hypothetical protein